MKKHAVVMPNKGLFYGYLVPVVTVVLFAILIGVAIFSFWYRSKEDVGELIVQNITQLAEIFKRIEQKCTIIGFEHQKNFIDFLTIKKGGFVGSQVGSLNLAHPDTWDGPYVSHTLTMQGIPYQVVSTNQGYFIAPGDGVVLPQGKKIGQDILLDEDADIEALIKDGQELNYRGKPLAVKIMVQENSVIDMMTAEDIAQAQQTWLQKQGASA